MAEIGNMLCELRLLERQLLFRLIDLLTDHDQLLRFLVDLRLHRPQLRVKGRDLALQRSLLCEELSDLRPGGDDLAVEALQLSLLVVDVVRDGAEQHNGQHGHGQGRAESGQPHCLRNRLTPR